METGLKIADINKMLQMLKGIEPALQSKIVKDGILSGAKIINSQAKQNLYASKKNKSKTGYQYYSQAFRIEPKKALNAEQLGGAVVGVKNYKLRWIQWGTKKREMLVTSNIKSPKWKQAKRGTYQNRGQIKKTNFFYSAVETRSTEALNAISAAIIKSLEQNLNKSK